MKKLFITTSIPYVNADPHIGFALEATQADVRARFHRLMGDQVRYQSGTDENALKNVQAAEAAGMQTVDFINQKAESFYRLRDRLDLSWDDFIRTTEDKHKSGAQKLWLMTKPDDIYKKVYKGLYCIGCESFYEIEDLNENGECFEHPGKRLETVEEENYFFKLSNYQSFIEDILNKNKVRIYPETRKNEVWGFVKRGLEDFSISRSRERAKNWGVEVPNDKSQVMYVWYDALANYITALDFVNDGELYRDFWVENDNKVHVIGKGISRFHAIYWLAMLESAGISLPSEIFIHGYVTSGGQKISKSIGNVIDPFEQIERYGVDAVRYFLLKEIPSYGDGDYTDSRFVEVYNADLANGIGNLVSRLKKLCINFSISGFEKPNFKEFIDKNKDNDPWLAEYCRNIVDFRLDHLCDQISLKVNHIDKVLDDGKPWKFMKNGSGKEKVDAENCIKDAVGLLLNIAVLLSPVIPQTSRQILDQFCDNINNNSQPLFPRISSVG